MKVTSAVSIDNRNTVQFKLGELAYFDHATDGLIVGSVHGFVGNTHIDLKIIHPIISIGKIFCRTREEVKHFSGTIKITSK